MFECSAQSAFSARFAKFGMNFYELFVPDLMHEFELGVWKGTFIHLMRLLSAQGEDIVQEFNRRYVCYITIYAHVELIFTYTIGCAICRRSGGTRYESLSVMYRLASSWPRVITRTFSS